MKDVQVNGLSFEKIGINIQILTIGEGTQEYYLYPAISPILES
jgi:hypothetical protein